MGDRLGSTWKCFKRVFSTQYVRDMFRSVRLNCQRVRELPMNTFEKDGALRYPRWDDQRKRGTFDLQMLIANSKKEYRERLVGMTGLSGMRKERLEKLVSSASRMLKNSPLPTIAIVSHTVLW